MVSKKDLDLTKLPLGNMLLGRLTYSSIRKEGEMVGKNNEKVSWQNGVKLTIAFDYEVQKEIDGVIFSDLARKDFFVVLVEPDLKKLSVMYDFCKSLIGKKMFVRYDSIATNDKKEQTLKISSHDDVVFVPDDGDKAPVTPPK